MSNRERKLLGSAGAALCIATLTFYPQATTAAPHKSADSGGTTQSGADRSSSSLLAAKDDFTSTRSADIIDSAMFTVNDAKQPEVTPVREGRPAITTLLKAQKSSHLVQRPPTSSAISSSSL